MPSIWTELPQLYHGCSMRAFDKISECFEFLAKKITCHVTRKEGNEEWRHYERHWKGVHAIGDKQFMLRSQTRLLKL